MWTPADIVERGRPVRVIIVAFAPAGQRPLDLSYRTMSTPPRTGAVCQLETFAPRAITVKAPIGLLPIPPPQSARLLRMTFEEDRRMRRAKRRQR